MPYLRRILKGRIFEGSNVDQRLTQPRHRVLLQRRKPQSTNTKTSYIVHIMLSAPPIHSSALIVCSINLDQERASIRDHGHRAKTSARDDTNLLSIDYIVREIHVRLLRV